MSRVQREKRREELTKNIMRIKSNQIVKIERKTKMMCSSDDTSLCEMKKVHSTALIALLPDFTKILSPNTGILILFFVTKT